MDFLTIGSEAWDSVATRSEHTNLKQITRYRLRGTCLRSGFQRRSAASAECGEPCSPHRPGGAKVFEHGHGKLTRGCHEVPCKKQIKVGTGRSDGEGKL